MINLNKLITYAMSRSNLPLLIKIMSQNLSISITTHGQEGFWAGSGFIRVGRPTREITISNLEHRFGWEKITRRTSSLTTDISWIDQIPSFEELRR